MQPAPEPVGDPPVDARRHIWLLLLGLVLLGGVGVTVYRARSVPVVSANEAARQQLERSGVDPSASLSYEHVFVFPSKSQATIAVRQLGDDFEVSSPDRGSSDSEWTVTASQTAALDLVALDALTRRLDALAVGLGGVYDGWSVNLSNVTPSLSA